MTLNRILVIKLGALGDFIYALGPMKAIREHHKDAHIILLTQKPYTALAEKSGYFDEIILDPRPKYNPLHWIDFKSILNDLKIDRVYDLQNNDRTSNYFRLFPKLTEWVGVVRGASHRNTDPDRQRFHAFLGLQNNLKLAGIEKVPLDPLDWMQSDLSRFDLKKPYALLVAGSSPGRPNKRWPTSSFRRLCEKLILSSLQPVLLGSSSERDLANEITTDGVLNLAGETSLDDIATLARGASVAIGNDTGPMHIISMTGCPVVMFYRSDESNILKHGPQGESSACFEVKDLKFIGVDEVLEKTLSLKRDFI